jgi:hypothetical protein
MNYLRPNLSYVVLNPFYSGCGPTLEMIFFSLSLGIPIVLTIAVKALQVPCSNTYLVAVYLLLIRVPVIEKFLA